MTGKAEATHASGNAPGSGNTLGSGNVPGSGNASGQRSAETSAQADNRVLLDVQNLTKHFPIRKGLLKSTVGQVRSVDGVDFQVREGETLGLVGESGCGKTTTARCLLRALQPTSGSIHYRRADDQVIDVASLPKRALPELRREMQMVFQDPFASLNPRMNLLDLIAEPMLVNGVGTRASRRERVAELLTLVGLRPEYMRRFPHAFSGGQRQRVVIARALALEPRLVVADEPVSALDVSVQAQVLNLLLELQQGMGLTYIFVAHDLSVVRHISDRVAVMYVGRIVELAPTRKLFHAPRHPYTSALMSAVPVADPRVRARMTPLEGDVPSPANAPSGCHFHPRCTHANQRCIAEVPEMQDDGQGHWVRCHRASELSLPGVLGSVAEP